jgi:WD40 repeat protein
VDTAVPATRTPVPSATITTTPSLTPTPEPSPTPTLPPIAAVGTAIPEYLEPLGYGNATRVNALAEWQQDAVTHLAWAPDGKTLAAGGKDSVTFYDANTRQIQKKLTADEGLIGFSLSPDGRYLATGSNDGSEQEGFTGNISFWRLSDDVRLFSFYLDHRGVSGLTFSPNGNTFLATVTSKDYIDNGFVFWNAHTWEITRTMRTGGVLDAAFSPDGLFVASTPDRFAIRMWEMKGSRLKYEIPTSFTGAVNSLAFSPDGKLLATGHYDGAIRLYDAASGALVREFITEGVIASMAFSPDGTLLATGESYTGNRIRLWDTASGLLLRVLQGHTHAVDSLAFSADGRLLASGSYDGVLRLWGAFP